MADVKDEWLTLREAARAIGKSPITLRRAIDSGRITGAKRVPVPGSRVSPPWMVTARSLREAGYELSGRTGRSSTEAESGCGCGRLAEVVELRIALARSEGQIKGLYQAMSVLERIVARGDHE